MRLLRHYGQNDLSFQNCIPASSGTGLADRLEATRCKEVREENPTALAAESILQAEILWFQVGEWSPQFRELAFGPMKFEADHV